MEVAPNTKGNPEGPIRLLVQTSTHLVPGDGWAPKYKFMLNTMCERHFNRRFDDLQDRGSSHGGYFAYPNLRCYFLVDHGQSSNDDEVPIIWYEWTGKTLLALCSPAHSILKANVVTSVR